MLNSDSKPKSTLPFQQIDVFTKVPFQGNPVAVVLDGNALTTVQMQTIACWTNLSETTFVCQPTHPDADYYLRIFTTVSEMPFAGHPTIGSAYALLRSGLQPKHLGRLIQQCGRGLVTIRIESERLMLALPTPQFREASQTERNDLALALRLPLGEVKAAAIIDVGPIWFTAQLTSAATVLALEPDMDKLSALSTKSGITGINVFGLQDEEDKEEEGDVEVRSFAPADGVNEDPVCGSGNGCVAALIQRLGLLAKRKYQARQGRRVHRDGRVEIEFDGDGTIWLGGAAVACIEGTLQV